MSSFPFPISDYPLDLRCEQIAQETLPQFLADLSNPRRTMQYFSALVRDPNKEGRLIWIADVREERGKIYGVPAATSRGHLKDSSLVSIPYHAVVDWLYVHNLRLIGGRSFRKRIKIIEERLKTFGVKSSRYEPIQADYDYSDRLQYCCVLIDENIQQGTNSDMFDAIGNHERKAVDLLFADHTLINTSCFVASKFDIFIFIESLSPLLYAIDQKNEAVVDACLKLGDKATSTDDSGHGPLHYAVRVDSPSLLQKLIDYGCDIEARATNGFTPLTYAISGITKTECINVLIEKGANVNDYCKCSSDQSTKETITGTTLSSMNLAIAKLLYDSGARFDRVDEEGMSPLHIAAFNQDFELAGFLLQIGGDPLACTNEGETPAMLAQMYEPENADAMHHFVKMCEESVG